MRTKQNYSPVLPAVLCSLLLLCSTGYAHGVAEGDKGYIQQITGLNLLPLVYLEYSEIKRVV